MRNEGIGVLLEYYLGLIDRNGRSDRRILSVGERTNRQTEIYGFEVSFDGGDGEKWTRAIGTLHAKQKKDFIQRNKD